MSRSRSRSPDRSRRRRSASLSREQARNQESTANRSHDESKQTNTSARGRSRSPTPDHRPSQNRKSNRQRSYSPVQSRQNPSSTRRHHSPNVGVEHTTRENTGAEHTIKPPSATRDRSLSPYSQRIALTRARNQT